MRKTKVFGWLLAIALCACMALWIPQAANAADEVTNEGQVTINGVTTQYATLGEALAAVKSCTAEDNAVVTILKDIDLGDSYLTISSGVFTIDLNGFEISSTYSSKGTLYIIGKTVNVTVNDSGSTGKISGGASAINTSCNNSGVLTIAGGTFSGSYGIKAYECVVNISGGNFIGSNYGVCADRGSLNITGGSFSGKYAVSGWYTTLTISGGTISGSTYDIHNSYSATIKLVLGENGVGANFPDGIRAGNVTLNVLLDEGLAYWNGDTMITVFSDDWSIASVDVTIKPACKHEAGSKTGYVNNGDNHDYFYSCCGAIYTENHSINASGLCICGAEPVAQVTIGSEVSRHATLKQAFQSVSIATSEDNAVVTVLKDLSDVRQTDITGVFTLDLNGCVVRGIRGWDVFYFARSANVTITGGTIIPNLSYAVNNYGGSVIINDVTIVENNDSNGVSVSNGGQLTVNGATDISGYQYAINASDADVTINGGKFLGF